MQLSYRIMKCRGLLFTLLLATPVYGVDLKVAVIQYRSSFFDVSGNARRIIEILNQVSDRKAQVAVFPECALTGYREDTVLASSAEEVTAAEESVRQACSDRKIAAIIGSVYRVDGRIYNTAVVFNSRGELVERYAKMYLAGEKWATPGNHISFFELEGVQSTVMICHDERYPELVRLPAIAGARIVYYVSHESGLKEENKLAPYRAQLMARAVENRVFVVAANAPANFDLTGSHGQSRIISADGNIMKEASFFNEDVLIDNLTVNPGKLAGPVQGSLGAWWQEGVTWMMRNRFRPLD